MSSNFQSTGGAPPSPSIKQISKKSQRENFWNTVLDTNKPPLPTPSKSLKKTATKIVYASPLSGSSQGAASLSTSSNQLRLPSQSHSSASASSSQMSVNSKADPDVNRKAKQHDRKNRPYKCEICRAGYTLKGDMVRHMRYVHEGIRPYQCSECGNAFGRRSILNKHLKTHMNK